MEKTTAWLIIVALYSFFMVITYWVILDTKPAFIEKYSSPYATTGIGNDRLKLTKSPPLNAGDSFYIYREYCIAREINHLFYKDRYIVNGFIYQLPSEIPTEYAKIGCHKVHFPIKIPEETPPGDYVYIAVISYKVNPLVTLTHELSPVGFTVK